MSERAIPEDLRERYAIPLTMGLHTLVDPSDFMRVAGFSWNTQKWGRNRDTEPKYYAVRTVRNSEGKRITVLLHRVIMGLAPDDPRRINHINGDGLDNRKSNLRIATQRQNACNVPRRNDSSMKYKGVQRVSRTLNKFRARIKINGKEISSGYFDTQEQAHERYKELAIKYNGEFARFD